MNNTLSHAQREIDILLKTVDEPIIKDFIPEILKLVKKFGNSGQSGGSAPYYAKAISQAIEKLCLQQPLCPITGIDEEWCELDYSDKMQYQNNRESAIFKESNGECYYIDAVVLLFILLIK